jgi:hypothetical protein
MKVTRLPADIRYVVDASPGAQKRSDRDGSKARQTDTPLAAMRSMHIAANARCSAIFAARLAGQTPLAAGARVTTPG